MAGAMRVIVGGLIAVLGASAGASAQAPSPPSEEHASGPSLRLPVCAELPFDPAVYVRALQPALAAHRRRVAREHVPDEADPRGLEVAIEASCSPSAAMVVVHLAHRDTGNHTRARVLLEGDTPAVRASQLARETASLLHERWADLGRPDFMPAHNPYRLAGYDTSPRNPYRSLGDFVPVENPYFFRPPRTRAPGEPRDPARDDPPVNPYVS